MMLKILSVVILSLSGTSLAVKGRSRRFRSSGASKVRGTLLNRHRGTQDASIQTVGTPEQIEEWKDHGMTVKCTLSDTELMELSSHIDANVYSKHLHGFIDQQSSRFVAHNGNFETAQYLKNQFKAMGLKASEQVIEGDHRIEEQSTNLFQAKLPATSVNTHKHTNVVGILKGSDLAHEVVLLGAHYDSVNWENTAGDAPGVDDNGSGTALLLSIAHALTEKKFQPRRSIMFVAFNAEEEGLVGSEHFAKMLKEDTHHKLGDLKAAFIADEVAWPGRGNEKRMAIFETHGEADGTNAMVDTLAKSALFKNSTSLLQGDGIGDGTHNFVVNYHGFGSDHMSFLDQGFPAVLLIERDDDWHADTYGHSARDTFEHVDLDYGASMTRLALRAVASFASPKD